jgi:hypothetical protein
MKHKLIERKHGEDDQRKIKLNITPKGTAVSKKIYKANSGLLQDFENYLNGDEIIIRKKIEQFIREHVRDYQLKYWSGKRDSNSRPQPWQGCALPLSYSRLIGPILLDL